MTTPSMATPHRTQKDTDAQFAGDIPCQEMQGKYSRGDKKTRASGAPAASGDNTPRHSAVTHPVDVRDPLAEVEGHVLLVIHTLNLDERRVAVLVDLGALVAQDGAAGVQPAEGAHNDPATSAQAPSAATAFRRTQGAAMGSCVAIPHGLMGHLATRLRARVGNRGHSCGWLGGRKLLAPY